MTDDSSSTSMSRIRTLELAPLATVALMALAGTKLLAHVLANSGYGYFIDELYYLACAEHLGFGYVDHPPMIGWLTWLTTRLVGVSLPALRSSSALFGAATVFLTGVIARRLGGDRFAQCLAALAVLIAPYFLVVDNYLSMNALDALLWSLAVWVFLVAMENERSVGGSGSLRWWVSLGAIAGVALLNKISIVFLAFGLFVGVLASPQRRVLTSRGPYLATVIAAVLFLPHIVWQIARGWPTLEFMANATQLKNRAMSPFEFISTQALEIHPFGFVLLVLGLVFFLRSRQASRFRYLGWGYLAMFLVFLLTQGKPYYLAPSYPLMLAGGATWFSQLASERTWLRRVVVGVLVLGGLATAPLALPVLPVETYVAYQRALLGGPPASAERKSVGPLPQHFADMFGHRELVVEVAEVYHALPESAHQRTAIFAAYYPQAGAIDLFGAEFGLPEAISGHNSYWLWGPGRWAKAGSADVFVVVGGEQADLEQAFASVEVARRFSHPYAMPWRNDYPIYVCRGPRASMAEMWGMAKEFI